jgi:hypothetical protein
VEVGISSLMRGSREGIDSGPERFVNQTLFDEGKVVGEFGVLGGRDTSGESG